MADESRDGLGFVRGLDGEFVAARRLIGAGTSNGVASHLGDGLAVPRLLGADGDTKRLAW